MKYNRLPPKNCKKTFYGLIS